MWSSTTRGTWWLDRPRPSPPSGLPRCTTPIGTNHFADAGHPADDAVAAAYEQRCTGLMDDVSRRLAALAPDDADPAEVARQIVRLVGLPKGSRPFRVSNDPADDGAEDIFRVGDRVRQWFYQRIGMADLLSVRRPATPEPTVG
jgi:hypothetical protein